MTKLEMLTRLEQEQKSSHQMQVLERLSQVQALEKLPEMVADQVTEALKALNPVLEMKHQVSQALGEYDKITALQRASIEGLVKEISDQATLAIEQKISALDKPMNDLSDQVSSLKKLPAQLDREARSMMVSSQNLANEAQKARQKPLQAFALMLISATLGALLVPAGQQGLSRLLPPDDVKRNAQLMLTVWENASPQERKLITEIASRHAK